MRMTDPNPGFQPKNKSDQNFETQIYAFSQSPLYCSSSSRGKRNVKTTFDDILTEPFSNLTQLLTPQKLSKLDPADQLMHILIYNADFDVANLGQQYLI
jgi:hypothetical protein